MGLSSSLRPLFVLLALCAGGPAWAVASPPRCYEPLSVVKASVTNQLEEGEIRKLEEGAQLVGADYFTVRIEGADKNVPDVVLIPGLATPSEVWNETAAQLKDRYRLHIIQIRGFGDLAPVDNPLPQGKTHFDDYIHEVADYIDDYVMGEMNGSKPIIIGHSLGGLTAMTIAARAPQLVEKVMLVDSLPYGALIFDLEATVDAFRPQAEQMRDALAAKSRMTSVPWIMDSMSATESGRKQVEAWAAMSDPKVVARFLYDLMTTDMRPVLPDIMVPMTMVYPVGEAVISGQKIITGYGKDYVSVYAGAKTMTFEKIDGSRHFIMLDQPEAFAAAIEQFLESE